MAITLSKIANNNAQVSFSYQGDTVNLVYYPGHVTEKIFAQLQSFSNMDENNIVAEFAAFNTMLAGLIKSWDVYQDDAETVMYPLDPERLADLPFAFRVACIQTIMGDIRPNTAATQG